MEGTIIWQGQGWYAPCSEGADIIWHWVDEPVASQQDAEYQAEIAEFGAPIKLLTRPE